MEEYENNGLNGCTNRKDQDDSQEEAIRAEDIADFVHSLK